MDEQPNRQTDPNSLDSSTRRVQKCDDNAINYKFTQKITKN